MAGGFIHEIKNHLSTLGLNLQLLAEDFEDPQNQRERRALERVQRLQGECLRLVDLSNDFLRFARVQDLELLDDDLVQVVEEMVDFVAPMAKQTNVEIKCYLPHDLPRVALDRELFKQALLNLLLNALQAMPGGGELTFQAACHFSSERVGPREVCLSLIDTGHGMPEEVKSRVFKPFFSTKPTGTGLGLATTKRIVEAHAGTLDVESEIGKGTRFTIKLPAHPAEPLP